MTDTEMLMERGEQVLKGRYHIDQVLHRGVKSTVYSGFDRKSGRVAIKVLEGEHDASLVRSSYLANAVGHPSAVNVLDTGSTEDGAVFLVMELLEATSMRELVAQHEGRLPVRLACNIADQGLDLLACAHAQGIVHGEIELAKLFFTRTERLKLLGFDRPQSLAQGGVSEQACAADVRAFAKVFAWLLSSGEQAVPMQVSSGTPTRIASVVERALSTEPGQAQPWKSAAAMRTALQLACQAELGRPVDRSLQPLAAVASRSAPQRSARGVWLAAAGALLAALYTSRELTHVPGPNVEAQSDVAAVTEAPATSEPPPEAPEPAASLAAEAAVIEPSATPAAAASPATANAPARLVPRKPTIPELRTPIQRRVRVASNIAPASPMCAQLRVARRTRSLTDEETQLFRLQCNKR